MLPNAPMRVHTFQNIVETEGYNHTPTGRSVASGDHEAVLVGVHLSDNEEYYVVAIDEVAFIVILKRTIYSRFPLLPEAMII